MLIKTVAGPSIVAGTGLFADEFIPRGTIVWEFTPGIDEAFTKAEVEDLPEPKQSEILSLFHAYISKQTGLYINCGDNAKYVNHSYNPNIILRHGDQEEICYAIRDIQKGEEITENYNDFDEPELGFEVS